MVIFFQIFLDIFHICTAIRIDRAVFLSRLIALAGNQKNGRPLALHNGFVDSHTSVFDNLIRTILLSHILGNVL